MLNSASIIITHFIPVWNGEIPPQVFTVEFHYPILVILNYDYYSINLYLEFIFSKKWNISIHIGFFKNPLGLSIYPIGDFFHPSELIFHWYFFFVKNFLMVWRNNHRSGYTCTWSQGSDLPFEIYGFIDNCTLSGCKNATLPFELSFDSVWY